MQTNKSKKHTRFGYPEMDSCLFVMKKININIKIIIVLITLISICNFITIISTDFANLYRKYVFNKFSSVFAFFADLFPFSVGEIMIVAGIILLILFIISLFTIIFRIENIKKVRRKLYIFFAYVLVFIYFTETFNAFMLYHTEPLKNQIITLQKNGKINNDEIMNYIKIYNYSISDLNDINKLLILSDYINVRLNELSEKVPRDSQGNIICTADMSDYKECLLNISDLFPLLKGYYPDAKKIYFSNIMTMQYLSGIYFPFSMEANYNKLMDCVNYPATISHELCHLKGYIREDEANFLAYLACINSNNILIQYSGLLSVQWYLENDLFKYGNKDLLKNHIFCNETVMNDDVFVSEEILNKVQNSSVISPDIINDATDKFLDTNLKINGISSGIDNYNEVVKLLLIYYFG